MDSTEKCGSPDYFLPFISVEYALKKCQPRWLWLKVIALPIPPIHHVLTDRYNRQSERGWVCFHIMIRIIPACRSTDLLTCGRVSDTHVFFARRVLIEFCQGMTMRVVIPILV